MMTSKVFFKPWVGKNYPIHGYNGIKILLLGESHYCGDCLAPCSDYFSEKCKNKTIKTIEDFLNYKKGISVSKTYMKTYTKFANIFFGKKITNDELIDFWNSVAFYNYMQIAMDNPRQKPTMGDFETGDEPFTEVMQELNPDVIIVWGNEFWKIMPPAFKPRNNDFLDKQGRELYYYHNNGKDVPAMGIHHPSTPAFNYQDHPFLKKLMDTIL